MDVASANSEPRSGILSCPSSLEAWPSETTALFKEYFAYHVVVELIQNDHFDERLIQFPDVEAQFAEMTLTIESAVSMFNEYLTH